MDIDIKTNENKFKMRVGAVVVCDGKLLVAKARKFEGFVFPGGHVQLGETSREAMLREFEEETGVKGKIDKLLCVHENIYNDTLKNRVFQEIVYYYVITPDDNLPKENYTREEMDGDILCVHHFEWIDINKAKELNVRPSHVIDLYLNGAEEKYILTDER